MDRKLSWFASLFFVLLISCNDNTEVHSRNGSYSVSGYKIALKDLVHLEWKVGNSIIKDTVSKGIRLALTLPNLDEDWLLKFYEEKEVDSYIIRVRRSGASGSELLGYFYVPIVRRNHRINDLSASPVSEVYFQIVYHAIGPAKRFESFRCPAFGHNKVIDGLKIVEDSYALSRIVISNGRRVKGKVQKAELAPVQFVGGSSLRGKYMADFAFYNSQKKILKSSFVQAPQYALVEQEKSEYIEGCANFEVPKRKDKDSGQFKFGR